MFNALSLLTLAGAVVLGACASKQDHTVLLRQIPTEEITLVPQNTHGPELTLRLPRGFSFDWTAESDNDAFILFNPRDTGDYQQGMLVINVTTGPVRHIPDSIDAEHSRAGILGMTVEWRAATITEPNGLIVHQREAILRNAFPLYNHPKGGAALVLQAFVVGSDLQLVERLMGSAETITTKNVRPDT